MRRVSLCFAVLLLGFGLGMPQAYAIPNLQLYIEGATYNASTETWDFVPSGGSFTLWAIGNTLEDYGGHGDIEDVSLIAAYNANASDVSISLTPTTTNYLGVIDVNPPGIPVGPSAETVGGAPDFDGRSLPGHGVYGDDTAWVTFGLGDFTEHGDSIGDFNGDSPFPALIPQSGQINAYEVLISGTDLNYVHFDLTGDAVRGSGFAPFSHDAQVPETSSLALWGILGGVFAVGCWFRRRRRVLP